MTDFSLQITLLESYCKYGYSNVENFIIFQEWAYFWKTVTSVNSAIFLGLLKWEIIFVLGLLLLGNTYSV